MKNPDPEKFAALAYFDLFDYPLTKEELEEYRLLCHPGQDKDDKQIHCKKYSQIIEKHEHFSCLKERNSIIETRKKRKIHAQKLWKKAQRFARIMHLVPFIRMIAVVNNLAYNNPTEQSDIDLFIITKKNRLFIARTLITLFLHALGIKRHHKKIKERFCLSFFISDAHLNLKKIQIKPYDVYLAYWMKTLTPLFGEKTYKAFLKANEQWLKKYFPKKISARKEKIIHPRIIKSLQRIQEWILDHTIANTLERHFRNWQIARARRKANKLGKHPPHVIIKNDMLKFHDQDQREAIYKRWIIAFSDSENPS